MIEVNEQLAYIKHFLKKEKPSIADVVECYLTAADLYLQLEDADKVIECLTATEKPMFSYNNGVLFGEYTPQQIDPNSILNEMNAKEKRIKSWDRKIRSTINQIQDRKLSYKFENGIWKYVYGYKLEK